MMSQTAINITPKMRQSNKKENALEACLRQSFCQEDEHGEVSTKVQIILFLDFNNIRGKSDFAHSHAEFLMKVSAWMKEYESENMVVICAVDHASKAETYALAEFHNHLLVVFAGPNQTADDVIAEGTRYFVEDDNEDPNEETVKSSNMVFVVTSDGELRQRCLRCNPNHRPRGRLQKRNHKKKKTNQQQKDNVKVFSSFQYLDCLEANQDTQSQPTLFQNHLAKIERDIRLYESQRPPWSSRQEKIDAMALGTWKSTLLEAPSSSSNEGIELVSTVLPEKEFTAETYPDPTTAKSFREFTWHRVLIAESMRRLLLSQSQQQHKALSSNQLLVSYQEHYHLTTKEGRRINGTNSTATDGDKIMRRQRDDDPVILWDDHRIRHDRDAQHYLRLYLDESFRTANVQRDHQRQPILSNMGGVGSDDDTEALETDSQSSPPHIYEPKTPLEEAVETLMRIFEESQTKTQDQFLMRYMKEAPSNLQFSRREDLQNLLLQLAVRERRGEDTKPQWYLREQSSSSPSLSPNDVVKELEFYVQPGRGRRRRRQRAKRREKKSMQIGNDDSLNQVDEKTLIEKKTMKDLQTDWFGLVITNGG